MKAALEVMPTTGVVPILGALGLSVATYYRNKKPKETKAPRPTPARALSSEEKQAVLDVLHEERFQDHPPAEVVGTLAREGKYLASERTMYRLLSAEGEVRERRNQLVHPSYAKPELVATAPNQVWSWDITKLLTFQKFVYLYLYVVMDIFSRYVVGWLLADRENATLARLLLDETVAKHGVEPGELILHQDRGAPMRSKLLIELLSQLDVARSYSRPHTSNDNPFSESAFKTMKYRPTFPKKFGSDVDARAFCKPYFEWYNEHHCHSGIAFLTPADVHFGRADEVLRRRFDAKLAKYHEHPERFVKGPPRLEELPRAVYINPPSVVPSTTSEPNEVLATSSTATANANASLPSTCDAGASAGTLAVATTRQTRCDGSRATNASVSEVDIASEIITQQRRDYAAAATRTAAPTNDARVMVINDVSPIDVDNAHTRTRDVSATAFISTGGIAH